jgi:hypothetical protein
MKTPIIILFFFHILMILLIWTLGVTMNTHPGEIPLYWVRIDIDKGILYRRRRL